MDHSGDQTQDAAPVDPTTSDAPDTPVVPRGSVRGDVVNVIRGFCMGAADTVPGVSGGTVALILGHYRRLVTAISHFDGTFLRQVFSGDLASAARRIDFRFLLALGIGVVSGVILLTGTMHWLLEHRLQETFAVFLGLMVASVWLVKDYITEWSIRNVVLLTLGVAAAVMITLLPSSAGSLSLPFLFVSASLAICAMILPGISGAFVLLVLGVYHPMTGMIKDAVRFNATAESLVQITVFISGCAFGLLAFSRGLRWLLEHYQSGTMAGLMGLMIGSLGKLWPLQMPTPETAEMEAKLRVMQYVSPADYQGSLVWLAVLAIFAVVFVIAMERIANLEGSGSTPEAG